MAVSITIDLSLAADDDWLLAQLRKLRSLEYRSSLGGMLPHVYLVACDGQPPVPGALYVAVDSLLGNGDPTVFQQVVFEPGNVAFLGPRYYLQGGVRMPSLYSESYSDSASGYDRGTWTDGILSLVSSLTAHVLGLSGDPREVSGLVDRIASFGIAR